jgi:hypothetical protein
VQTSLAGRDPPHCVRKTEKKRKKQQANLFLFMSSGGIEPQSLPKIVSASNVWERETVLQEDLFCSLPRLDRYVSMRARISGVLHHGSLRGILYFFGSMPSTNLNSTRREFGREVQRQMTPHLFSQENKRRKKDSKTIAHTVSSGGVEPPAAIQFTNSGKWPAPRGLFIWFYGLGRPVRFSFYRQYLMSYSNHTR